MGGPDARLAELPLLKRAAGLLLGVILVACASTVPTTAPDAAPPAIDASADVDAGTADAVVDAALALDARTGLGLDADCDPTRDECGDGLTCRPLGNLRGACRSVGPLPAGAACQAESDCGYAMTWYSDDVGVARCAIICDTAAPQLRCKPDQPCLALVGHLGFCLP